MQTTPSTYLSIPIRGKKKGKRRRGIGIKNSKGREGKEKRVLSEGKCL